MGRVISLMADKDWLLGERQRLVRATPRLIGVG